MSFLYITIHVQFNSIRQLEQSLDLMKDEFESMEDYWQGKMDKERKFYENQIRDSEEKFKELEDRLKEYIGLLPEKGIPHVLGEGLYTIEEASNIEYQVIKNNLTLLNQISMMLQGDGMGGGDQRSKAEK